MIGEIRAAAVRQLHAGHIVAELDHLAVFDDMIPPQDAVIPDDQLAVLVRGMINGNALFKFADQERADL